MKKFKSIKVLSIVSAVVLSIALLLNVAFAQNNSEEVTKIRAKLQTMIPVAAQADIQATDIDGIYRLDIQGNYAYVHVNGDYVLIGDLLDTKKQVNVGDQAQSERMVKAIEEFPLSKMIVFEPQQSKRHITVITDVDCGWCRKLHTEVPSLNDAGVAVRYIAWPRAGVGSASYKKFVSVWCNGDQQQALTDAKAGKDVPIANCENPIADSTALATSIGVRGTPAIILDDGRMIPGYKSSADLVELLGI